MEQIKLFKKELISENETPPEKKKKRGPGSKDYEPISKEEKAEYYKNQFGEDAKPYFYSKEENDAAARKASEKVLGKERQAQ